MWLRVGHVLTLHTTHYTLQMSLHSMKDDDVIAIIKACTIPFADMATNLERLCLEFNAMSERERQMCRRDRISQSLAKVANAKGKPRRKRNVEKTKGIQSGYQIFVSEKSIKGLDLAVCPVLCVFLAGTWVLFSRVFDLTCGRFWCAVSNEGAVSAVGVDGGRGEGQVHEARR